jgi:hypothetical protein
MANISADHNPSSIAPLNVARIENGSFPSWLYGAKKMHHRVFSQTPLNTIADNATQEPHKKQHDDGYDEQSDYCLNQAQAVPQLFHVVASHVPPSSTYRLKISSELG